MKGLFLSIAAAAVVFLPGCGEAARKVAEAEGTKERTPETFEMVNDSGRLVFSGIEAGEEPLDVTLKFKYTNTGTDPQRAFDFFYVQAYQGDVELRDVALNAENDYIQEAKKEVAPGEEIEVGKQYKLSDDKTPITVKVSDWSPENVALELYQTFQVDIAGPPETAENLN